MITLLDLNRIIAQAATFLTFFAVVASAPQLQVHAQQQSPHPEIEPWMQTVLTEDGLSFSELSATEAIEARGTDVVIDQLVGLLEHPDVGVRSRSAIILQNLQQFHKIGLPNETIQHLAPRLADADYYVRASAASAIATFGERTVTVLIEQLKSKDPKVLYWSVWALGEIGRSAETAVDALIDVYQQSQPRSHFRSFSIQDPMGGRHDETDLRKAVTVALSKIWSGSGELHPFMIERFDGEPRLMADEMARLGEKAVPFLSKRLKDGTLEQKNGALDALLRIPGAKAAVVEALKNPEARIRESAAWNLGWNQEESRVAIPDLLRLLDDDVLEVRRSALHAIVHIGADSYEQIVERVLRCANSTDPQMRLDVLNIMNRAAREDATNEKLLLALLDDYYAGNAAIRKAVLVFFESAEFSAIEQTLVRESRDQQSNVGNAAKQILDRFRYQEIDRNLLSSLMSLRPNTDSIGAMIALRIRLQRRFVDAVFQFVR